MVESQHERGKDMARNVIYYNQSNSQYTLAEIANLPYTDVILEYLLTDGNLNVYGDGGAFDSNTGNLSNPDDIRTLQNAGKNVLVSFGGDTGTFPTSAWKNCAQNVVTVANNIAGFVKNNGLNGVDIDFEDSNAFTQTQASGYSGVQFLIALTQGLAQALPPGQNIITHAPQTPYWYQGDYQAAYLQIWQQAGDQITWFNNQFYSNPDYDATSQLKVQTYQYIANISGGPPPQKLLVGVPLTSSVEGYITIDDMVQNVITPLEATFGGEFGGVMAWQFSFDTDGNWSNGIWQALVPGSPFTPPATGYSGIQIGSAPAMATFNNALYIAFQANDPGHALFVTSSPNGMNFASPALGIPGISIGSAPAMAAFNNRLYIAFQANDPSHSLFVTSSADGRNWTSPAQGYPGIQIGSAPAMAAFNNRLYIAFQANDPSNQLYVTSSADGVNFTTPAQGYPGIQMGSSPAMTVFNYWLFISFQANDPSHALFGTTSQDGINFKTPAAGYPGIQLGSAPGMTALNGRLYISFQANDPGHALFVTSSTDAMNFTTPATEYPGILIGSAPAMGEFNQQLFAAFQANDPSHALFVASPDPAP
jgi:chitinase